MFTATMKRSTVVSVIPAILLTLLAGRAPAQSAPPSPRRSVTIAAAEDPRDPVVFRRNVYAVTHRLATFGTSMNLPPDIQQRIAELRGQLDSASPEEFAYAAEQIGPEIAEAEKAMARITIVPAPGERDPRFRPQSGAAWHQYNTGANDDVVQANYPFYTVNQTSTSQSSCGANSSNKACSLDECRVCEEDSDCFGIGNCAVCDAGPCVPRSTNGTGSGTVTIQSECQSRPTAEGIRQLRIASAIAEGVAVVASRICEQDWFGINVSIVCIITDILHLVVSTSYDMLQLCRDEWNDAESTSVYDRLAHLHGDVDTAQASVGTVQTNLANGVTNIQNQLTASTNNINMSVATLSTNVDDQFTQTNFAITEYRGFDLRERLERTLREGTRLGLFYLPEPTGHLGMIRTIVDETIANVQASGESVNNAQTLFGLAVSDHNAGRYKRAFTNYSLAYFEAIKLGGERQ